MNKIFLKKDNLPQETGCYLMLKDSVSYFVSVYLKNGIWHGHSNDTGTFLIYDFEGYLWSDKIVISQE